MINKVLLYCIDFNILSTAQGHLRTVRIGGGGGGGVQFNFHIMFAVQYCFQKVFSSVVLLNVLGCRLTY